MVLFTPPDFPNPKKHFPALVRISEVLFLWAFYGPFDSWTDSRLSFLESSSSNGVAPVFCDLDVDPLVFFRRWLIFPLIIGWSKVGSQNTKSLLKFSNWRFYWDPCAVYLSALCSFAPSFACFALRGLPRAVPAPCARLLVRASRP